MNNFFKILGGSFLGILLVGMSYTILNKNEKVEENNLSSLSGTIISDSGSIITGSNKIISPIIKVKEKTIAKTENLKQIEKLVKIEKASPAEYKKIKEENIIINNIKKELAGVYVPNKQSFPGVNLKTKVDKTFLVGVHSLKINDKSFKVKSGYIYSGDTIKQLLPANYRGCFKMEVLSSRDNANIGKIGYVCKKYLKDNLIVINKKDISNVNKKNKKTKVGNIYSIYSPTTENSNIKNKKTDNISIINIGAIIEQVEDEDESGCFKILVLRSYLENKDVGKVGYVCNNNIDKAEFYSK